MRIFRKGLFVLACLITVIAILYVEENWRGKRAWEKYKLEWEAKGEKFDLMSFVPPPVRGRGELRDGRRFWRPLFDLNPRAASAGSIALARYQCGQPRAKFCQRPEGAEKSDQGC